MITKDANLNPILPELRIPRSFGPDIGKEYGIQVVEMATPKRTINQLLGTNKNKSRVCEEVGLTVDQTRGLIP